jgi:capsular polysaccharide biosynthesis protein
MELTSFMEALRKKQKIVWLWIFGLVFLSALIAFSQPLKYGATSQVLVVQNFGQGTDPYTVSRSNEYLSNILARVITSQSFLNETLAAGFDIDKSYFPADLRLKMKLWQRTVSAVSVGDSGVIEISVYHPEREQAEQLAQAINYTLKSKNSLYHGFGEGLSIKVLDQPLLSVWPVKPNIPVNLGLAAFAGLLVGLLHVYALAAGFIVPQQKKIRVSASELEALILSKQAARPTSQPAAAGPVPPTVQPDGYRATVRPPTDQRFEELIGGGDIKNIF